MLRTDATPQIVTITSPANNSTTTDSQISVSVTASDPGSAAGGVAHVYVDGQEATYNPGDNTWSLAGPEHRSKFDRELLKSRSSAPANKKPDSK